jgi:hypothetical protein
MATGFQQVGCRSAHGTEATANLDQATKVSIRSAGQRQWWVDPIHVREQRQRQASRHSAGNLSCRPALHTCCSVMTTRSCWHIHRCRARRSGPLNSRVCAGGK